jgi:DNA-directed RNA polymerase subunit RPC12/RpoP
MATERWVLICSNCGTEFTQSTIEATNFETFLYPPKPSVPEAGAEFECPKCGYKDFYDRTDLAFRREQL